jgi:hypothetical protein
MKNNPLFSIIADSTDRMFVTDKSGKTIFFPWVSKKQGYYVKSKNLIAKIKRFYKISFFICFALLIISLSFFDENFWGIVGSMMVCFSGWYFAYQLYVSRIVKFLQPAKTNYKQLVLAEYAPDDSESEDLEEQNDMQFPAQWGKPITLTDGDPSLGIKRAWSRLSPAQLFIFYFLIGVGIIMVSVKFIKHEFWSNPVGFLIAFLVSVMWGLAFFVIVKNIEGEKKDWWGFINWKLPIILVTVACWGFAVFSLYKFFAMIIA